MKVQNLNSSSKKTKKIIKSVFAEMLSEKRELSKISVSELCSRAEISRGAFYSHYDDIYGVAEDYENELIDMFFDNARLLSPSTVEQFVDSLFDYIRKNDDNYKLLCCSNDFLFTAKKLTAIASNKFLELCYNSGTGNQRVHRRIVLRIRKVLPRVFGRAVRRFVRVHAQVGGKFFRPPV